MWASGAQDEIYSKYDTVYTNQNGDHTLGKKRHKKKSKLLP